MFPNEPSEFFSEFARALRNPEVQLVAHNAMFEQWITLNVFAKRLMYSWPDLQKIPVSRWHCTAALARSVGLPSSLEDVSAALGLKHQKDMAGHRLMLKMAKPRKATKNDDSVRHLDPDDLARLGEYCAADIAAEVELFLRLPPLTELERKFWCLDQRINRRGFAVDRPLVLGALELIVDETQRLDEEMAAVTFGAIRSARQNAATIKYLEKVCGLRIPNLQAGTVRDVLAGGKLSDDAHAILSIRAAAARSSTSKWTAFAARSLSDGRARDNTLFNGAHTGRQSGTGLQPQNLFKTVLPQRDVEAALPLIAARDREAIEALYEKPMDLYASSIRSAIVAAPGHVLDVGDFSTIEVRVLFWLAGHARGLKDLAEGKELYLEMASEIYEIDLPELEAKYRAGDSDSKFKRQLGKQTVLGAGFGIGIGGEKFQKACKQYNIEISLSLAQKAIAAYREKHRPIPVFWKSIESAAIRAMQCHGKDVQSGKLTWCYRRDENRLTVQLPIGRLISYQTPKLELKRTLYGESLQLTYMGINAVTKQWERQTTWGGKLAENVTQGVARDLLFEAMLRLERHGVSRPVLAVHDEIVGERRKAGIEDELQHKTFLALMSRVPPWAKGLPVKVEGWTADRYRK